MNLWLTWLLPQFQCYDQGDAKAEGKSVQEIQIAGAVAAQNNGAPGMILVWHLHVMSLGSLHGDCVVKDMFFFLACNPAILKSIMILGAFAMFGKLFVFDASLSDQGLKWSKEKGVSPCYWHMFGCFPAWCFLQTWSHQKVVDISC